MKKSQKKFQKYFSYQPNKDINPDQVKSPLTLPAATPHSEKKQRLLEKGNKIPIPLVILASHYKARRLSHTHKYKNRKKSERQLSQPLELKFIKLSCLGLLTFLATLLTTSALTPLQPTSAEEILFSAEATGSSVSLTTTGAVNLSMETSPSGTVRTAADTVKVTAGSTGYQLYISAANAQTSLVRDGTDGTDSHDIIPTLDNAGALIPISDPIQLETNTWGFAATGTDLVSTANFDDVYAVGDNSNAENHFASITAKGQDILISRNSSTVSEVPTTFYYGVNATTAKPSGLYKNTVIYTAISDTSASNLASVTPQKTTMLTGGELLTISTPSTLTLNSIGTITVTIGGETCIGATAEKNEAYVNVTCYAPALATGWHEVIVDFEAGESYVVNPGIEYYAAEPTPTMQNFTLTQCNNLPLNSIISLTDVRDGNVYEVAKLADGHCWMVTNLMLGNTIINSGSIEINSNTSDYTGTAFKISSDNIMANGKTNNWTNNDYDMLHIYARVTSEKDTNGNIYGNLYNWYTATAQSGTRSMASGDAPYSICPKGWRLPSSTGDSSYINLFQTPVANGGLGVPNASGANITYTDALQVTPYNLSSMTGYWLSGSLVPGLVVYWIRAAYATYYAQGISFTAEGGYNFQSYGTKYVGYPVRCVFSS